MDDAVLRTWLAGALADYSRRFPGERWLVDRVAALEDRVHTGLDLRNRGRLPYHLTASAIVVDDEQALLVWHHALGKWLQPGGHLDPGETPWDGARRETAEEAGVLSIGSAMGCSEPQPLDIDLHPIPASSLKQEPAHFHLDLRFLLGVSPISSDAAVVTVQAGSARWVNIAEGSHELDRLDLDPSLQRALGKAREELVPDERPDAVD
jgi:8-oxo-dGTP pyrophosphatase MutT (NUDIX family)